MKDRVVAHIVEKFGKTELLDSFELGLAHGEFGNTLTDDEERDFYDTIRLTRDLDNVPIVVDRNVN
jgi:hypothetical protein